MGYIVQLEMKPDIYSTSNILKTRYVFVIEHYKVQVNISITTL